MPLKIVTTLLFFIPFVLTLAQDLFLHAAIIFLSIISSLLYHHYHEKRFLGLDTICSILLMAMNLYVAYLSDFTFPYFHLALVAVVFSFYFWYKAQKIQYDFNHSMWHVASVVITLFCIWSYAAR